MSIATRTPAQHARIAEWLFVLALIGIAVLFGNRIMGAVVGGDPLRR